MCHSFRFNNHSEMTQIFEHYHFSRQLMIEGLDPDDPLAALDSLIWAKSPDQLPQWAFEQLQEMVPKLRETFHRRESGKRETQLRNSELAREYRFLTLAVGLRPEAARMLLTECYGVGVGTLKKVEKENPAGLMEPVAHTPEEALRRFVSKYGNSLDAINRRMQAVKNRIEAAEAEAIDAQLERRSSKLTPKPQDKNAWDRHLRMCNSILELMEKVGKNRP